MGRKRSKEIIPGSQLILYLPQDIDPKVLMYLNDQTNISKALLELAYDKVYRNKDVSFKNDLKEIIAELIEEKLNEGKKEVKEKPIQNNKRDLIFKMQPDSIFKSE